MSSSQESLWGKDGHASVEKSMTTILLGARLAEAVDRISSGESGLQLLDVDFEDPACSTLPHADPEFLIAETDRILTEIESAPPVFDLSFNSRKSSDDPVIAIVERITQREISFPQGRFQVTKREFIRATKPNGEMLRETTGCSYTLTRAEEKGEEQK